MTDPEQRKCWKCGAAAPARLSGGWKEHDGKFWCPKDFKAGFILLSVTIPVAGPIAEDGQSQHEAWKELRGVLKQCWGDSTRLANWAVRELAKADVTRSPEMAKLPKMPKVYLYPGARRFVPTMDTSSIVAVLHAVEGKYREHRYAAVWLGSESLPSMRWPQPYPVSGQAWSASVDAGGRMLVSLRLGCRRRVLRLRGGAEFGRQIGRFRQIASGAARIGELALYEVKANASDHRVGPGVVGAATRLMCKMVAYLPRQEKKERDGAFIITTSAESMLVGLDMERKPDPLWKINGDHIARFAAEVKRWTEKHAKHRQRWYEDSKMEFRRGAVPFAQRREAACAKFNRRVSTAVDQFVAQVVGYADRRRFAEVRWAPAEARFVDSFPWHTFALKLKDRLDAAGIAFSDEPLPDVASGPDRDVSGSDRSQSTEDGEGEAVT